MTGLLTRPPAAGSPLRPGGAPREVDSIGLPGSGPPRWLGLAGDTSLAAVTLAAALGLARLFTSWSFALPVVLAALGAHAVAVACRRAALGPLASALAAAAGLALAVAWVVEPHSTTWGLPTPATWTAVSTDLADAWERFGDVKAPTAPTRGFVLASFVAVWLAASAADAFAFRLRARFEAAAPTFTLFVFGAILAPVAGGSNRGQLAAAGAYLGTLAAFVAVTEVARRGVAAPWVGGGTRAGHTALLRRGLAIAAAATVVGVVAGPLLPGAKAPGLVGWRDDQAGGSRSRTTVSPLVDIRGRIVDQSDVEMFTVGAPTPAYWRLTALERFDGAIWSSLGTYQPARGELRAGPRTTAGEDLVVQDYAIGPLSSIWLPAAFRPVEVEGAGSIRHDAESASLVTAEDTSDGLAYRVHSAVPAFTAAELSRAGTGAPRAVVETYLELPSGFPEEIGATAAQVVALAGPGAGRYEQAVALQQWFRETFTYDLDVSPGHGVDAISHFLTTRRGYCEQFAGTYAAMARALGWPARVAVGFTPGAVGSDGRYHVAGRDAHAWPEVYLAGFGWVAFEPTPGRSIPGGESYTGIDVPGTASDTPVPSPSTTVVGGLDPGEGETEGEPATDTTVPFTPPAGGPPGGSFAATVAVLALANGGYLAAVAGGRRWLRARRRRAAEAEGDSARVLVAWAEAEDALALAGLPRGAAETPAELAARAGAAGVGGGVTQPLSRLASATTVAGFAPAGAGRTTADAAYDDAGAVERELRAEAGWRERLRWTADPRPLVRMLRAPRRRAHRRPATRPS